MNGVPDPVVEDVGDEVPDAVVDDVGDDVADAVVEGAADVFASELPLLHATPKNIRRAITAAGVIRLTLKLPFH